MHIILAVLLTLITASSSMAASARTYVSRLGTDSGGCTRSAPCASFTFAFGQTLTGGEITVLDSSEYGGLTVDRSVSIIAEGAEAGISEMFSPGLGINVNTSSVVLRVKGLTFQGAGANIAPQGIHIDSAAEVHIENCTFYNLNAGVAIQPTNGGKYYISDSTFAGNGAAVFLSPNSTANNFLVLTRVKMNGNSYGVYARGDFNTGEVQIQVKDSTIAGSANYGVYALSQAGLGLTSIGVTNTHVVGNGYGVYADRPQSVIILDRNTIQNNGTAVQATSSASVYSYGNNAINNNGAAGSGVTTIGLR